MAALVRFNMEDLRMLSKFPIENKDMLKLKQTKIPNSNKQNLPQTENKPQTDKKTQTTQLLKSECTNTFCQQYQLLLPLPAAHSLPTSLPLLPSIHMSAMSTNKKS